MYYVFFLIIPTHEYILQNLLSSRIYKEDLSVIVEFKPKPKCSLKLLTFSFSKFILRYSTIIVLYIIITA